MSSSGSVSKCDLFPHMQLEDVFLFFLDRFEVLQPPRSVSEIGITAKERDALATWIGGQQGYPALWCDSLWQVQLDQTRTASNREMYGSLLVIAGSQLCREEATEDAVWPTVTSMVRPDKGSYQALFAAGQPTVLCKKAIVAGARRLQLRNVIDRYGAQEYFDTLKLQFGFTRKGAMRRLPDWLDGLGMPLAVKLLLGLEKDYQDLASDSFRSLWFALQDYRRGRARAEHAENVLLQSPWVSPEWTSQLLAVTKERLNRRPTERSLTPDSETSEKLYKRELQWEARGKPRLSLRVDEERLIELVGSARTITLAVDGKVTARWLFQENGEWRGSRTISCEPPNSPPNLRPRVLSIGADGLVLAEIDLTEDWAQDPFTVFDLTSGAEIDPGDSLYEAREYGFICDADFAVPGASRIAFRGYAAYRVATPWHEPPQVTTGDSAYWIATTTHRAAPQPMRLTLEIAGQQGCALGAEAILETRGVPTEATSLSLTIGNDRVGLRREGDAWRTEEPVPLTLELAMGDVRRRLQLRAANYTKTVVPRLNLSLRGAAFLDQEDDVRWTQVKPDRPLNRADGSGYARIFFDSSEAKIYEGSRFVGNVRRLLPVRDLHGWGAPLTAVSSVGDAVVLVPSVIDRGLGAFLPPLFRGQSEARVRWRTSIEVSRDHKVYAWTDLTRAPAVLDSGAIQVRDSGFEWRLPNLGDITAMAITFRGARLSAWWSLEKCRSALTGRPSRELFALARWLKIPLLSPDLIDVVQKAARQAPADLVESWLRNEGLLPGLAHRDGDVGAQSVFRDLMWDISLEDHAVTKLARVLTGTSDQDGDAFKQALILLGEAAPSLPYLYAKSRLRSDKYRRYVQAGMRALLGLPEGAVIGRDVLDGERRRCANILQVGDEVLSRDITRYEEQLARGSQGEPRASLSIRRLGGTADGPRYLSACLLGHLIERTVL